MIQQLQGGCQEHAPTDHHHLLDDDARRARPVRAAVSRASGIEPLGLPSSEARVPGGRGRHHFDFRRIAGRRRGKGRN